MGTGASQASLVVKNLPANAGDLRDCVGSLGWEDPLEEGMATNSSFLSWEIPWIEEPSRLQSLGSQRIGHDLVTKEQHGVNSGEKGIMGPDGINKSLNSIIRAMNAE